MYPGQEVKVVAADPGPVNDIESFCNQTGDELLESQEDNEKYIYRIKKC